MRGLGVILFSLLVWPASGQGLPYTLTTIADTTGPYLSFSSPFVNDNGYVVFRGRLDAGGEGIFTGPNPATDVIADSTGPFSSFTSRKLNNGGTVVFRAYDSDSGQQGLFTGPNPATDTVVDTSGPFDVVVSAAINDMGVIAFRGILDAGGDGIYTGPNPATDTFVDDAGPFSGFGSPPALNNNGRIVFAALLDAGGEGILGLPENLWVESKRCVASAPGESTCFARPPLRFGPSGDTPSATALGW